MTALEKLKTWITTYPGFDALSSLQVDYADQVDPGTGSLSPSGMVEVERRRDVLGNAVVTNQYNFVIYCVFEKSPGDDEGATHNADWMMGFQEWVQEQSVSGRAPTFGDEASSEEIKAQNGALYETSEGVGTYMVQLSVQFKKKFERMI